MIEPGGFIESVNDWYQSPLAISNDGLLCAFVELRLMTSNVLELVQPRRDGDSTSPLACHRPLLRSLSERVQRWKSKWSNALESGKKAISYELHIALTLDRVSPFSDTLLRESPSVCDLLCTYAHVAATRFSNGGSRYLVEELWVRCRHAQICGGPDHFINPLLHAGFSACYDRTRSDLPDEGERPVAYLFCK